MAINSYEICDKVVPQSASAPNGKLSPSRLIRIDFGSNEIISNAPKRAKVKKKDMKSPYLAGDTVQLLSRVTERRLVHKKAADFVSSFPLAANLYKASSDEFKTYKRNNRKARKSVLTLPNEPSPMPQICTVSDINESEYYQDVDKFKLKYKTRLPVQNRKSRPRNKDFQFYDRDARLCSQMNIDLDCSSTDMIKNYEGDGKRVSSKKHSSKTFSKDKIDAHDNVWAVLRNINRFQFRPSPRISEESVRSPKRKKGFARNRNNRKKRHIIETCRTEEIAYLAKFEVDSKSQTSASQSSSYDRITVIDKKDVFDNMQKEINQTFTITPNVLKAVEGAKNINRPIEKSHNKNGTKNSHKAVVPWNRNIRTGQNNKNRRDINKISNKINQDQLQDSSASSLVKDSLDSSNYNGNFHYPEISEKFAVDVKPKENTKNVTTNQLDSERGIPPVNCGSRQCFFKKLSKDKLRPPSVESNKLMRGMTKVVLSNDQDAVLPNNHVDNQKRKPRLVTTMPSAAMMPKLTTADIKRRLAHIKFPLVILGKDQISSSIELVDYDPPQFNGLDEHIWPYMVEWTKKSNPKRKQSLPQNKRNFLYARSTNNLRKGNNEVTVELKKPLKDKKNVENIATNKKKIDQKRGINQEETNSLIPQQAKKTKPLRQFKDKMLKLLFKKPSNQSVNANSDEVNRLSAVSDLKVANKKVTIVRKQVDVSTETDTEVDVTPKYTFRRPNNIPSCYKTNIREIPSFNKITSNLTNSFNNTTNNAISSFNKTTNNTIRPFNKTTNNATPLNKTVVNGPSVNDKHCAKYPWARAKWTSDFIENVIRKMKDGAYYSHEEENYMKRNKIDVGFIDKVINKLKNGACVDLKEIAIQTPTAPGDRTFNNNNPCCLDLISELENDHTINIPGFDEKLPDLEVETLNMNRIAIKHCLTNVMVQFDVAVPEEPEHFLVNGKKSSSCIALSETDSHTKVFKCKTTIVNAVLPAELCSVLPKIMRNFMDGKVNLTNLPMPTPYFAESQLSTITETTIEGTRTIQPILSLPIYISPILRKMQQGIFLWKHLRKPISQQALINQAITSNTYRNYYRCSQVTKIFSKVFNDNFKSMLYCIVDPYTMEMSTTVLEPRPSPLQSINDQKPSVITTNTCTALLPYTGNNGSINGFGNFDFMQMMRKCMITRNFSISFDIFSNSNLLQSKSDDIVTVNLEIETNQGINRTMSISISKLKMDSLFTGFGKQGVFDKTAIKGIDETAPLKAIECAKGNSRTKLARRHLNYAVSTGNKVKRRGFVRLYKKCKSTSNIAGEKCSTALNKIGDLEDFFQAMGSGKLLSSVFDGAAGKKILTSIFQMKNWITDITPRQAMLVLLLTNKKDTPNLMRFRPVLLQGIAVKRITRATELDMEIEVIERETFNKFPQFEGISYVPASVENHNNLLEELCWIAKTTASDYQKTFDENSERLLKSLLEKRKKLNPSYLRVMARYVGLGLLKASTKN